MLLWS
jgi:hypothetical protein